MCSKDQTVVVSLSEFMSETERIVYKWAAVQEIAICPLCRRGKTKRARYLIHIFSEPYPAELIRIKHRKEIRKIYRIRQLERRFNRPLTQDEKMKILAA